MITTTATYRPGLDSVPNPVPPTTGKKPYRFAGAAACSIVCGTNERVILHWFWEEP